MAKDTAQMVVQFIETTASGMKLLLKQQDIKAKKDDIKQALANVMLSLAKGETVTASIDEPLKYNSAADMLTIAYRQYLSGAKAAGLKTISSAFENDDMVELVEVLDRVNQEAKISNSENESSVEANDLDSIIANLVSENDDEEIELNANDEDEDNGGSDDDDSDDERITASTDDDDEDEEINASASDDDDDDTDTEITAENDLDDDEDEDEEVVATTNPTSMAKVIAALRHKPEIIAAANKMSQRDIDAAQKFLIAAANKLKKAS